MVVSAECVVEPVIGTAYNLALAVVGVVAAVDVIAVVDVQHTAV